MNMAMIAEYNPFLEIALILGLAAVLGALGQKLRQPLIIMFLATGILAGPSFFGIIKSYEEIELLAHMGIALLLFIVGLKLDLNLVRTTGPVALATGLGQIHYEPGPDFDVYPGDRIVIMGPPGELKKAEELLNRLQDQQTQEKPERFAITEILIAEDSEMEDRTLAELRFRQKYGVTVVGIRRKGDKIVTPGADDKLKAGDYLVLIGTSSKIDSISKEGSL
jgi:K+/H+ antiporter YhaU regulatory subunit KhtT